MFRFLVSRFERPVSHGLRQKTLAMALAVGVGLTLFSGCANVQESALRKEGSTTETDVKNGKTQSLRAESRKAAKQGNAAANPQTDEQLNIPDAASFGNISFLWDSPGEFSGGYFDVFYENGSFYALPSIYANNLERYFKRNPTFADINRSEIGELYDTLWIVNRLGRNLPLVKHKSEYTLDKIWIRGNNDWNIISEEQARNAPNVIKEWALGFAGSSIFRPFSSPSLVARANKESDGNKFYIFGAAKESFRRIDINGIITEMRPAKARLPEVINHIPYPLRAIAILTRKASADEKKILERIAPYKNKIFALADSYAKPVLTPVKRIVAEPKLIQVDPLRIEPKDEFETTAAYEKRKAEALSQWEAKKKSIDQGNDKLMLQHAAQVEVAEKEYQDQVERLSRADVKEKAYADALKRATLTVLGTPRFRNIRYDADKQTMFAELFSVSVPEFRRNVDFKMPLERAKTFKDDMLNGIQIPLVNLNQELAVVSVETITNTVKIGLEFAVAKQADSVKAYEYFINIHPNSPEAKQAQKRVEVLRPLERQRELERQKEDGYGVLDALFQLGVESMRKSAEKQAEWDRAHNCKTISINGHLNKICEE
jgi:hypothetical protein